MSAKVGVLGAGAWGTAVAKVLQENGAEVTLWCLEKDLAETIRTTHCNERFLPGVTLPARLEVVTDVAEAASGRDFIVLASPSLFLLPVLKQILNVPSIREGETVIGVITKGFLPGKDGDDCPRLIVETLEGYLPGFYRHSLVYIAGPSHAEEVSRGKITGLIAASENARNSFRFRDLLKNKYMRVYSSLDVKGVQVAAAAKNVIAIAFGIMDALKNGERRDSTLARDYADSFGDGTASFLLAAGLNEIQTLGQALGATHPQTFTSISGIGDLDVTCRSVYGRNRRFGREIIEKNILRGFENIDDLIARIGEIGYLPEGAVAAKHVKRLIDKHNLRMPISSGLYRILNKEIEPEEALDLMLGE